MKIPRDKIIIIIIHNIGIQHFNANTKHGFQTNYELLSAVQRLGLLAFVAIVTDFTLDKGR